ncbi:pth [Symbiodinium pilosum]|uniref:Pth protein n=1 Tax=Symbiodinium pilosum TaxID=2952 RepID=A0A812R3K7_SYMPI|nr:pth [Symbiodinium pilosum]
MRSARAAWRLGRCGALSLPAGIVQARRLSAQDFEALSIRELQELARQKGVALDDCFEKRDMVDKLRQSSISTSETSTNKASGGCAGDATDKEVDSMSIAELRSLIHEAGLSSRDLLERGDFLQRAKEAKAKLRHSKGASASQAKSTPRSPKADRSQLPWDVQRYKDLEIVLFARGGCPHCVAAFDLLKRRGLADFELQDVEWSKEAVQEFRRLGGNGVPHLVFLFEADGQEPVRMEACKGVVHRSDLERVCRVVGLGDHAATIWQALRPASGPQHPLEICDLEPYEAANLYAFTEEVFKLLGYHLNRAWGLLTSGSSGDTEVKSISLEQFQEAYSRLGLSGDADLIFRGLVSFNQDGSDGRLWKEELGYAWFLTIKAATIRTVPASRRPQGWEASGCRHAAQLLAALGFRDEVPRPASMVARLETFGFSASLLGAALELVACEVPGLRQGLTSALSGQRHVVSKPGTPVGMQRRANSTGAGGRPNMPEWDDSKTLPKRVRAPFSPFIAKKYHQRTDWLMGGAWRDSPSKPPFNPSARYESDPTPRTTRGYVVNSQPSQTATADSTAESANPENTPTSTQRVDAATQAGKAVAICIPKRDGAGRWSGSAGVSSLRTSSLSS